MFNIHRGYRRSSSSDEEPGRPPAGHPQPPGLQLPASGGGPQRPGLSRTHRVRRALFGRSDPEENIRFVRQELARHRESQSNRWNFDFERGQPMKGRLEWECVEKDQIHPVYKLPRLPYLSSHDESEQENKPGHQSMKTGLTGSVDDLKTPPSSTEPPDSVPCSTNLPPGGLPGSSGSGGIHGSRSVPSGLSNYDTGGGGDGHAEDSRDQEGLSSTQRSYGASYFCLSDTSTDPGGTSIRGSGGLSGHSSSSGSQGSTSRPPDVQRLAQPPTDLPPASTQRYSSKNSSSHTPSSSAAVGNIHSTSSQNTSGDRSRQPVPPAAASSRQYSSSTQRLPPPHYSGSSQSQPQPFRVPPSVPSFSGKIKPYVEAESSQAAVLADKKKGDQSGAAMSSTTSSGAETTAEASAGGGGGARPKTKEQKITDKFRSRKMSRSKSAGKLKRLVGGAAPSRSPSVKARNQSRSALPRS